MKTIALLVAMLIMTGCSSKTARDFRAYTWVDGTNVLATGQVAQLVGLLEANLVAPPRQAAKATPGVQPPALAFDLCVNVQTKEGKIVAQLLGYDRRFVGFDGLGSIEKSNVVHQIYDILKKGRLNTPLDRAL